VLLDQLPGCVHLWALEDASVGGQLEQVEGVDEPGNRCRAVGERPGIGHRAQEDRPRRTAGRGMQPIGVNECGQVGCPHVCLQLCGLLRSVAGQDTPVVEQPAQRRGIGHAAPGTTSAGRQ